MRKTAIALLGLALGACSSGTDVPLAQRAIDVFHGQIDGAQFGAIYSASSSDMKGSATSESLTQLLAAVHRKLGAFKSGKTVGWNDNRTTNGHFVSINYAAQYERGTADENFVYRIADGHASLAGYHITSNALIVN